jgi:ABC-2 type transport system permease protein
VAQNSKKRRVSSSRSPFTHLPRLPAAEFTATPLAWLAVLAVALAAAGLAAFRRRDLSSA